MDFIFGFFVGYLSKEIVSYLKRLSEYDWNNRTVYKEDWDWLSPIQEDDLPQMTHNNGYTQKELLNMVIERLDRLEEKLDAKLDKAEFYKVLTLLVALGGVVAAIVM